MDGILFSTELIAETFVVSGLRFIQNLLLLCVMDTGFRPIRLNSQKLNVCSQLGQHSKSFQQIYQIKVPY